MIKRNVDIKPRLGHAQTDRAADRRPPLRAGGHLAWRLTFNPLTHRSFVNSAFLEWMSLHAACLTNLHSACEVGQFPFHFLLKGREIDLLFGLQDCPNSIVDLLRGRTRESSHRGGTFQRTRISAQSMLRSTEIVVKPMVQTRPANGRWHQKGTYHKPLLRPMTCVEYR